MLLTADRDRAAANMEPQGVSKVMAAFQSLNIDDRLGVLWQLYEGMGSLVVPAAPDASIRIELAGGTIYEVAALTRDGQLQVMRDLLQGTNTPLVRAYSSLSNNNKLAFWYRLAQWMRSGEIVPVPSGYQLSAAATKVYGRIVALGFIKQVALFRLIVSNAGFIR